MNTPDYAAAVLATAEAGRIHSAELAALRRRLRQLADPRPGSCPVRPCSRSRTCHGWTSCPSRHLTGPVACSTGW
jgi:hypothetical protein